MGSLPAEGRHEEGDTIVAVDGAAVQTASDLHELLASRPGGASFTLTIERDGRRSDVEVQTERLPELSGGVGLGVFAQTPGPGCRAALRGARTRAGGEPTRGR